MPIMLTAKSVCKQLMNILHMMDRSKNAVSKSGLTFAARQHRDLPADGVVDGEVHGRFLNCAEASKHVLLRDGAAQEF